MARVIELETLEQQVAAALEAGDDELLRTILTDEHPADIADIIDRLDDEEQVGVFRVLPRELAAQVLSETDLDATRELLSSLPDAEAAALLDLSPVDDVTEILAEDVPDRQIQLLSIMRPERAAEVRELLSYPARSAGRLMIERFVQVRPDMSAGDALNVLRHLDPEIETINELFVLDSARRLIGVIGLRDVLSAAPHRQLADLLDTDYVSATPHTDQEEVARLVSQYNLSAIPVVSPNRRMLGIVTVDDVIDVLVEENTEDVLRFGGVESGPTDESYFSTPLLRVIRRRILWLLLLFLTSTITINVLGFFESELSQVVALSFFIPLLIGTGGNTGAQTVSTLIRALALGEIRKSDAIQVLLRELLGGIVLGLLLGCAALVLALVGGNGLNLALVVGLSIVAICTWANVMGAVVPMLARRFGLDPALVSAPMITTLVDATGLAIYLLIAKALLGL